MSPARGCPAGALSANVRKTRPQPPQVTANDTVDLHRFRAPPRRAVRQAHRQSRPPPHRSELFSDASLARLIETTPRHSYHVNTMDVTTHDPRTRREGMIEGLSGTDALEAVRKGHIWILLQQPHDVDGGYGDMLREVYAEIEERVPGFKSYKHKMSILISSPKVQVYYHADVPGQTLWQVRGTKRVYVYPNTRAVPAAAQHREDRAGRGARDLAALRALVRRLRRGDRPRARPHAALAAQLPAPHRQRRLPQRVVHDRAHDRRAAQRLRRQLRQRRPAPHTGTSRPDAADIGRWPLRPARARGGPQVLWACRRSRKSGFKIDFKVDPTAPFSVRNVPAFELAQDRLAGKGRAASA